MHSLLSMQSSPDRSRNPLGKGEVKNHDSGAIHMTLWRITEDPVALGVPRSLAAFLACFCIFTWKFGLLRRQALSSQYSLKFQVSGFPPFCWKANKTALLWLAGWHAVGDVGMQDITEVPSTQPARKSSEKINRRLRPSSQKEAQVNKNQLKYKLPGRGPFTSLT